MDGNLPFKGREEAGHALGAKLAEYRKRPDTIVLALVRGGVVVGAALAEDLRLPLFPYVVRKIGHPGHREFGLGAVAEGGETYLDDAAMRMCGLTLQDIDGVLEEEMKELKRRREEYAVAARPDLQGKTVILTDDGAATGGTLFAAIADLRAAGVASVVTAIPVCPPDTALQLREKSDAAIILATPEAFSAVGQWYADFRQTEDNEVIELLVRNRRE